jgi:hypothetical protein
MDYLLLIWPFDGEEEGGRYSVCITYRSSAVLPPPSPRFLSTLLRVSCLFVSSYVLRVCFPFAMFLLLDSGGGEGASNFVSSPC